MAIFPNTYMDATVVIGSLQANSQITWMASGFLVGRFEGCDPDGNKRYTIYLVTNKHVINGHKQIQLQFNSSTGVQVLSCSLWNGNVQQHSVHPNPNIDVVACRIDINGAIMNGTIAKFFELDTMALTLQDMKNTGVCEGTLVYALGFPVSLSNELVDNTFKSPVCRLGCISKIEHTYHGSPTNYYIIDAQTFPGNSGGPVINRPEFISVDGTPHNDKSNLIGIVSAYLPYRENLCSTQTGRIRTQTEENSGLTIIFPVDYIANTVEIERTRSTGLQPGQKLPGLQ